LFSAPQVWQRDIAVKRGGLGRIETWVGGASLVVLVLSFPAAMAEPLTEPATGMVFIEVPAGCFEMGDLDVGTVGRTCVDAFRIGRTEVTNAQYRALVPDHSSGSHAGHSLDGDDQPAVNISFDEALAYAAALSAATGWAVRLPTEAEWEFAARAGTTTARFWGAEIEPAHRFANLRDRDADYRINDPFPVTAPAASFEPNAFGLHDMLGNASEWVLDAYAPGADRFGEVRDNPIVLAETPLRVRRGGSFDEPASLVSSAARDFFARTFRLPQTGFRLVLVPEAEAPLAAVDEREE
jgi:formylglycine-generating enzyme